METSTSYAIECQETAAYAASRAATHLEHSLTENTASRFFYWSNDCRIKAIENQKASAFYYQRARNILGLHD